jgi:hypothetical protein
MYAAARKLQLERNNDKIVIDDTDVIDAEWTDSLPLYNLPNVQYTHTHEYISASEMRWQRHCMTFFMNFVFHKSYMEKYRLEKKYKKIFQYFGYYECENGYLSCSVPISRNVLMDGYFQSDKYFCDIGNILRKEFDLSMTTSQYVSSDFMEKIVNRNVVCLSAKVQHNVSNPMYNVCTKEYWEKAITYILDKVKNPLFFICSDNVEYVMNNLIDTSKYDVIEQPKDMPVHIALALMSLSKHFIIGNTTYAWWAQYLCKNPDKIVVAPSRWMNCDMPIDIYQDGWKLIDV